VEGHDGEVQVGRQSGQPVQPSDKAAQKRGDQFIASEMFLLAACDDKGETGRLLNSMVWRVRRWKQAINAVRGAGSVDSAESEGQRESLKKYTIDLPNALVRASLIR